MLLGFNQVEWVVAFWATQPLGAVTVLGNAWWSEAETTSALAQAAPVLVLASRPDPRPARWARSRPAGAPAGHTAPAGGGGGRPAAAPPGSGGLGAARPEVPRRTEDDPALIMFFLRDHRHR